MAGGRLLGGSKRDSLPQQAQECVQRHCRGNALSRSQLYEVEVTTKSICQASGDHLSYSTSNRSPQRPFQADGSVSRREGCEFLYLYDKDFAEKYPDIVKQEEQWWQVHYHKLSNDLSIGGSSKSKRTKTTATPTAAKAGSNDAPDTSKSSPKKQRRTKVEGRCSYRPKQGLAPMSSHILSCSLMFLMFLSQQ